MENLVIVESPAKAKTIEKILGAGFLVKSSFGHIRDLAKNGISIDIDHGFKPIYEVNSDKTAVVKELKKLAKEATTIYLASDEDREGEAIAWHLYETLGLTQSNTKRIVFQEITPKAIKRAVENPRGIDMNLVDAQQARRILDRLVGFELSPLLWKKIRPSLSAGRVQSVVVKLITEREREIMGFEGSSSFKVTGDFSTTKGDMIKATLKDNFADAAGAESFLKSLVGASYFVENVVKSPGKRTPAAPFTTSTLQQEASRKLGFSVSQTMSVAQKLYEAGHITYMRTDSVNLSDDALGAISREVKASYGENYYKFRKYSTHSKGAQEAHEAVRPTHFENRDAGSTLQEKKLYSLIWKRTVACQMADAQLEKTTITIAPVGNDKRFIAAGEVIVFDGFLTLYMEGHDDENGDNDEGLLPGVVAGEDMKAKEGSVKATQRFAARPARYSEASLVKKLEELGIGRPSTYAPTISTVIARGYVVKESRDASVREFTTLTLKGGSVLGTIGTEKFGGEKQKLFPTDIGMVVNDFLQINFGGVIDYGFTASVEEEFDEIAMGKKNWTDMISKFYKPFHSEIENVGKNTEYTRTERVIGVDPASGKDIVARVGRYGPMVQIGPAEDKKYAKLQSGQLIESITLDQALGLFALPRTSGQFEGDDMVVGIGRFGAYVRHKGVFTSLGKEEDPYTISGERCVELIVTKREVEKNKIINVFGDIQVLNGRFGPYITQNKANFKIPKDKDAAALTADDCLGIIAAQASAPAPKKRTFKKK